MNSEDREEVLTPEVAPPETEVSAAGVSAELERRLDPNQVVREAPVWPWSPEARTRAEAQRAGLRARLDMYRDDLAAIRTAHQALSRAGTMRAIEAAETAIFEIRTIGETLRLALLNRAQIEMTRLFVQQIEALEEFRGKVPSEILDALKERALEEYTARMNRASRAEMEFEKAGMTKLE